MTQAQAGIEGIWLTQEGNSKVEIYEEGDRYYGKIVWMARTTDKKGNTLTDKNNPDKSLRDRPLMGLEMLSNIKYDGNRANGKIYAPKRGATLDCELVQQGDDQLDLLISVKGFTRQQSWTRSQL
ncbi:MAG: DUF2147 domain-containing protein [Bacteroidota bacterium]